MDIKKFIIEYWKHVASSERIGIKKLLSGVYVIIPDMMIR